MPTEPFLGQIHIFAFSSAPNGWAQCNGQFLPINQNQALFSLLGTMYGGNGQTTFALPNLRGRVPIHIGQGFTQGQAGGTEAHTITQNEMPAHTHQTLASTGGPTVSSPAGASWASNTGFSPYGTTADLAMSPLAITNVGGSQPHENRSPFLTLNFCIALIGVFPSPN
jgi:microcystin-dependent protein